MTHIAPGIVTKTPGVPVVLFAGSHVGRLLVGADAFRRRSWVRSPGS